MYKTSASQVCLYVVLLVTFTTKSSEAFSQSSPDTIPIVKEDINLSFNTIYRQNSNPGFFGNEYANPIRTSLVADINPNVVLLNSDKSRFFVLFSPRVKLRLLDARKAPVRSPSYMPGLKVFSRLNDDVERPQFLSLAYSHHSNGQDGPTLDSVGDFNRGKGKFTTNYYTLFFQILFNHYGILDYKLIYQKIFLILSIF